MERKEIEFIENGKYIKELVWSFESCGRAGFRQRKELRVVQKFSLKTFVALAIR